jgi:hypothetical protein
MTAAHFNQRYDKEASWAVIGTSPRRLLAKRKDGLRLTEAYFRISLKNNGCFHFKEGGMRHDPRG